MTSTQIRQSFLDFFKSRQHTIVRSASLLPDSPNLLFTNAGMNQFVPIFLGQTSCPYTPGRAADTQKCIRAGGKHNDLDDVGLDTYHHTFFEMLGNWSFGDYFKPEAIEYAWDLVVGTWHFPPQRLYATVFCPYHGQPGWETRWQQELEQVLVLAMTSPTYIPPNENASPFEIADQEAAMYWAKKFSAAGCDPKVHIVPGNKKDNFWMMGETGPCGPCSELHVDLTPPGDTQGRLVNQGSAECIEIWNLVFIQFNANPDGTFAPLPAQHVDTGMGFERVTSIIQNTLGFTDFTRTISNYETDIFRPIFDALEKLCGKQYTSTLPAAGTNGATEPEKADIAFRVIADHIRTLSFAIADGIQPGNSDRKYVLRRILRRAVRYGRTLGFHEPFFYKLVDVLAETMGAVFPEIRAKKKQIQDVLEIEEEAFNKTLDRGIEEFDKAAFDAIKSMHAHHFSDKFNLKLESADSLSMNLPGSPARIGAYQTVHSGLLTYEVVVQKTTPESMLKLFGQPPRVSGETAFKLYDTYGFPLDLTELMARERGLTVDKEGFKQSMEEQRKRSQDAQRKEVIKLADANPPWEGTKFIGFDTLTSEGGQSMIVGDKLFVETTPFYAEMGGQVGDTGYVETTGGNRVKILNTIRTPAGVHVLKLEDPLGIDAPPEAPLRYVVDAPRRAAIQRHHTVTHLLHWALHEIASPEAAQKGSFVGPDKLTFDFNSAPLTPVQIADIEKLVNERILENVAVSWTEVPYPAVKSRADVMQFFGDKYGETVRVVQIGGTAGKLDGYSMELCGGTHARATGEIGLFRILGESAIAAGVRRIEAVAGLTAYEAMKHDRELIKTVAGRVNSPVHELEKKIESLLAQQKALEKEVQIAMLRNASNAASELLGSAQSVNEIPLITHNLGDATGEFLQAIADTLKGRFKGVVVLGGGSDAAVTLIATVSSEFTPQVQAGKIIQQIAPIVGGKGGGKPENARGGGKDASKLDEALAKVRSLLGP